MSIGARLARQKGGIVEKQDKMFWPGFSEQFLAEIEAFTAKHGTNPTHAFVRKEHFPTYGEGRNWASVKVMGVWVGWATPSNGPKIIMGRMPE